MRVVSVREIPEDDPLAVIELVPLDAVSQRAAAAIGGSDTVRITTTRRPTQLVSDPDFPSLRIVIGDLGLRSTRAALETLQSTSTPTLTVAVVGSNPAENAHWIASKKTSIDAVLPVTLSSEPADGQTLGQAVRDVIACATANRISAPVDELYRFFTRAGVLRTDPRWTPT